MRRWAVRIFGSLVVILILISFFPSDGAARDGNWILVDSVLATIKGVPVLRSDVQIEEDFGLLGISGTDGSFKSLLESYLNRLLVLRELEDIGGFRLAEGQAEDAYEEYLSGYGDINVFNEKLRKWGIDSAEIHRRFGRALLASLYTESRMKFYVKVLPSDIEKEYEKDPEHWGNAGVLDAWEEIRAALMEESFNREKDRWLISLKQRYDLVMLEEAGSSQE